MIRVKNSFIEVFDTCNQPRVRHRSVDVISRLKGSWEPDGRIVGATLDTSSDAIPGIPAQVDRETCNSEAGDNSECERSSLQSSAPPPGTFPPHSHQEPPVFVTGDCSEVGGNSQQENISVTSSPHPASMPQPRSLQGAAASSACISMQIDGTACSSEHGTASQGDEISIEASPHPSSMPPPRSLQGSAVSNDGHKHDWVPCNSADDDNSHAERISVTSSSRPPRASPLNNRFSGTGADAVGKLSMPETWELVTDEPWEHCADDEDSFSASHSSKPNARSCAREQSKSYTGQQDAPPENLTWDRVAARMAAQTDCIGRENQALHQIRSKLQLLQEKMSKEVSAHDRSREVFQSFYDTETQQPNRNIANWLLVNKKLSNLVQSQREVLRTQFPDAQHFWNPRPMANGSPSQQVAPRRE